MIKDGSYRTGGFENVDDKPKRKRSSNKKKNIFIRIGEPWKTITETIK